MKERWLTLIMTDAIYRLMLFIESLKSRANCELFYWKQSVRRISVIQHQLTLSDLFITARKQRKGSLDSPVRSLHYAGVAWSTLALQRICRHRLVTKSKPSADWNHIQRTSSFNLCSFLGWCLSIGSIMSNCVRCFHLKPHTPLIKLWSDLLQRQQTQYLSTSKRVYVNAIARTE